MRGFRGDIPLIQDYPLKVNFYGCKGNIYTLRSAGWKIATKTWFDDRNYRNCIQIAGHHEITKSNLLSEIKVLDTNSYDLFPDLLEYVEMNIQTCAGSIIIRGESQALQYTDWNAFSAPYPTMIAIPDHNFDPRRIPFFSKGIPDTELILPEYTVQEMLDKITQLQEPFQAELREQRLAQRRKAAQGEIMTDNLIQMPNVQRTIEIISI